MTILKCAGLAIILSILACGSGDNNGGQNASGRESESVQAVLLKYRIEVGNIPLMGLQSEDVELALSSQAVKYTGLVEITVGDEVNSIRHSSILDFSDTSQIFLNPADSSYSVALYKLSVSKQAPPESDEGPKSKSGYAIKLIPTEETRNIGPLADCRKFNVSSKQGINPGKSDSIPGLKGEIWLYGGDDVKSIILHYYKMQAGLFEDSSFEGLELWAALERLGIPRSGLEAFLDQLNGLVAKADFNVDMYSLGKKADVSITAEIYSFERKRLPGNYFEAPPQYKPTFGIKGAAGSGR